MPVTPKDYAVDCIGRARRLAGSTGSSVDDDVLRLSLALGVAALDSLVHWIVLRAIENTSDGIPAALAKLEVELRDLTELADEARSAQRSGVRWRPWVIVKNTIHAKLLRRSFQSKEDVSQGLAMAGVQRGWAQICAQLGERSEDVTHRLGAIVRRRNQIVHEGDYRRLTRPRTVETNPVDPDAIRDDLVWLERLINAAASVAGY